DSDQQLITINAASVANFVITTTNGENETAGTAFDLTITAVQGDGSTTATDYTGSKSLTFSTTATASPDGTSPPLPANTTYPFTAGVATASSATLYNSAETPAITVTDGTVTTLGTSGAGAGVTVADGATAEVRIKTAAEAADGDYNNNVFGTLSVQGPTQADPDATTDLFAVIYDAFGNLVTPAETGNWAQTGGLVSNGSFSDGGAATSNTFTFSSGTNAGTTYTGTITVTTTTSAVSDATGTITVDDAAPGTVLGFGITTDSDNQLFVFANWNINSSGDDGLTGDPTNYEIRWTDEVNGPIDTDGEWDAASPVNTTGKPAYSAGIWRINMTGATVGNKYFAMRTTDDVGNISPLAAGAYTTTSDYSLPVSLTSYSAQSGYGKVSLAWVTESEINNEGFFIYRAASADGPFTDRVNLSIIEGQGNSNNPTEYTFVDESVIADQTYYYKLTSRDFDGTVHENLGVVSATPLALPETYALQPNYPNPFNPSTNFRFSLPEAAQVNLVIYNALGQEVKSILRNRSMEAGEFSTFAWDATDNSGNRVTSGVYYAVMTVESARFQEVRKLVYLR
ncbi:MAG TPA: FlgD immunoglobulin-like domain containing protein, partial [Calditrichia bacterium]|nr:FlgD immunoglobulin-like domain containing protein [Calditrichia bacterium]